MQARADNKPLSDARAIHGVLASLKLGERVPLNILINDYANGGIPEWTVCEREEDGHYAILTLTDESNIHYPNKAALDIFTCPDKTLGGRLYQWFPGCIHARNMFGDIRQHARAMCDRWPQIIGKKRS
ncbi:hypothetical protein ccbrp13_56070 [Ktedonobacteria bacterium brp13]|nr:hypothetical protein ccbrp13_56070 [Ktedonobacteria bacterium brp13]